MSVRACVRRSLVAVTRRLIVRRRRRLRPCRPASIISRPFWSPRHRFVVDKHAGEWSGAPSRSIASVTTNERQGTSTVSGRSSRAIAVRFLFYRVTR